MRPILLPLMAMFLVGCDEFDLGGIGSFDRFHEDFHYSYPLADGGSLRVENFNGSIEISGWDKNTVDIDGMKYASTEYRLKELKIDISPSAGSITIRTLPPLDHRGNAGARFTIHVPKRTQLDQITSTNGAIRVDSIDGASRLHTSNGSVHASTLSGPLDVQTSNGSVEVTDISGDTTLHSSNGTIRAEVKKGRFGATTSNGSINVRLIGGDASPVRLESSNGHIDLTMDAAREVSARTSNSSITVRMPATANANLDAHTSNSSITCDFDVSVHSGQISKHHLEGKIGTGGPVLDLGTSNGSIKLLKL